MKFNGILMGFDGIYPLGMTNIAIPYANKTVLEYESQQNCPRKSPSFVGKHTEKHYEIMHGGYGY